MEIKRHQTWVLMMPHMKRPVKIEQFMPFSWDVKEKPSKRVTKRDEEHIRNVIKIMNGR